MMRPFLVLSLIVFTLASCDNAEVASPTAQKSNEPVAELTLTEKGKLAFITNRCPSCHKLSATDKVAPGLAGVTNRHTTQWIRTWLTNPQAAWEANEPETKELRRRYNKQNAEKTLMELKFPLTPQTIEELIAFLEENDQRLSRGEKPTRLIGR